MKRIDLAQRITILISLGILAGIAVLALELGRNNDLLRAQLSDQILEHRLASRAAVVNASDEVADFWVRVGTNAPLTVADELRLNAFVESVLLSWQFEYSQTAAGNLPEAELPVDAYRAAFRGEGFARVKIYPEIWRTLAPELRPDFVRWMQDNVIDQ